MKSYYTKTCNYCKEYTPHCYCILHQSFSKGNNFCECWSLNKNYLEEKLKKLMCYYENIINEAYNMGLIKDDISKDSLYGLHLMCLAEFRVENGL